MNFAQLNGKTIREAFNEFDQLNPGVYTEFKNQALKALNAGASKISSKAIINWIRWEFFIKTTDQNLKVNDAFTPMYARKFIQEFPEHIDKFEMRKLRTEQDGPFMNVGKDGQISFL